MLRHLAGCCAIASVLVFALPASSHAYICVAPECPVFCSPPSYLIGDIPAGLDEAETVRAINDAMAAWAAPVCSALSPTYEGRTRMSAQSFDGVNVIAFAESGLPSAGARAVARSAFDASGCILEADIEIDAQHYTWTNATPTTSLETNVFAAVLKAAGNIYGLGSSMEPDAVMNFRNDSELTALASDDIDGICALYPSGAFCTDSMCGPGETCFHDVCVPDVPVMPDAGMPPPADAGAVEDAGPDVDARVLPDAATSRDGSTGTDAGAAGEGDGGCDCGVSGAPVSHAVWVLAVLAWVARRRRRCV